MLQSGRSLPVVCTASVVLLFLSSCAGVDEKIRTAISRLDAIILQVDQGRQDFKALGNDLNGILRDLPAEIATQFRQSFDEVINNAVQLGTIEAMCSTDFVKVRISDDLRFLKARLIAKLTGAPPPSAPPKYPTVCAPRPDIIKSDCKDKIVWNGYDLMAKDLSGKGVQLAVMHVNLGGSLGHYLGGAPPANSPIDWHYTPLFRDALSVNSDYQVTADCTRLGTLEGQDRRLALFWGDAIISEVGVQRQDPPQTHIEDAALAPLSLPPAGPGGKSKDGSADLDFGGPPPKVTYSVCLQVRDAGKIVAVVDYDAIECDSSGRPAANPTEATDHWERVVYTAPTGSTLEGIEGEPCWRDSFSDTDKEQKTRRDGSFYPSFYIGADGEGPGDVGVQTTLATGSTNTTGWGSIKVRLRS